MCFGLRLRGSTPRGSELPQRSGDDPRNCLGLRTLRWQLPPARALPCSPERRGWPWPRGGGRPAGAGEGPTEKAWDGAAVCGGTLPSPSTFQSPPPPLSSRCGHLCFLFCPLDWVRAWLLGQLDSSLQQKGGSAKRKRVTAGTRTPPSSCQQDASSLGMQGPEKALVLRPPSTQRTGVQGAAGHMHPKS